MLKRSLADELIADRGIEEFRESVRNAFHLVADKPKFLQVAGHAYVSLAELWGLSSLQSALLLGMQLADFVALRDGNTDNLGEEQLERISCLLGIYMDLGTLYSGHMDRVGAWMLHRNYGDLFDGSSPYSFLAQADTNVFHLVRRQVASATV